MSTHEPLLENPPKIFSLQDLLDMMSDAREVSGLVDVAIPGPDAAAAWFEKCQTIGGYALRALARELGYVVAAPPPADAVISDVPTITPADKAALERMLKGTRRTRRLMVLGPESTAYFLMLEKFMETGELPDHAGGYEESLAAAGGEPDGRTTLLGSPPPPAPSAPETGC
jgi:hypothetical protein